MAGVGHGGESYQIGKPAVYKISDTNYFQRQTNASYAISNYGVKRQELVYRSPEKRY